jgi:gliding motility-associated-like protein
MQRFCFIATAFFCFLFPPLAQAQNVVVTSTVNTACNGLPCDWQGPSILINELMISPTSGDGSMSGPGPSGGRGEWIELYNPNVCHPVDISCYYLGNYTHEGTGGFRLPDNVIVPPAGFVIVRGTAAAAVPAARLVQNGGNVIEIVAPPEINMTGVCVTGTPGTRLWFPNAGGWFAFYDANGVPQDAVRWGPGNVNDVAGAPCIPSRPGCPNVNALASYNAIPANLKFQASTADANNHVGQSIRRIPDGGAWAGVGNATYANCNAACFDPGISTCTGTATVTSAPGTAPYTYQWNDPDNQTSQTAIGLCAGTYTVVVTSANGIVSTGNVTVNNYVPPVTFNMSTSFCINSPQAPFTDYTPVAVNNQLGVFTGTGVVQNNFNPALAGLGAHNITYTFTNQNGCTNSAQTTLTVNPLPIVSIANLQPICVNAQAIQVVVSPTGGVLTGPGVIGTSFNPGLAGVGTHTLTYNYTAPNGCSNSTTTQVVVQPTPTIQFNTPSAFCVDWAPQTLSASPAGGTFTYNSNPITTINPAVLGVGNHTFNYTVTNNFGCTSSSNYVVSVNPLPLVSFNIPDDLCLNSLFYPFQNFTTSPSGGVVSFSGPGVQNNGILAANAGVGNHIITLNYTDLNACQSSTSTNVIIHNIPSLSISNNFDQYCISDSITDFVLQPAGGFLYGQSVNNNQFFPNQSQPGVYPLSYIFIDENGCADTLNFAVEVTPLPIVEILTPPYVCYDSNPFSINTLPSSGGTLLINGAAGNIINPNNLGVGVHEIYLEYTDEIGCFNSTSRYIYIAPLPDLLTNLEPIEACPPVNYSFFGEFQNGTVCQWDFGDGTVSNSCLPVQHSYSAAGCYSPVFTVSNQFGCVSDTVLTNLICVFPQPQAYFEYAPSQLTIFNVDAQFMNLSNGANQYLWIFDVNDNISTSTAINPVFSFPELTVGSYPVTLFATSEDGCVDSFLVTIIVIPDVIIYVPNTFTPNGDSNNQFWSIFIDGIIPERFSVEVFNRWGELIFESSDKDFAWDGTYEGLEVPNGTYVWKIKATEAFSEEEKEWIGHVNVLR